MSATAGSAPSAATPPGWTAALAVREAALRAFVDESAERLSRACHEMARAFSAGGTLLCLGRGAAATDAAHAAVEFMHPVIVGKRALPALALSNDATRAATLARLAGPEDIALALCHGEPDAALAEFLGAARERGLLTIAIGAAGAALEAEFAFTVPSEDPIVVQEVEETAYHVLWELVHVFFEHPGLLERSCVTCGDVAVRATVVEVEGTTATVEAEGRRERVGVELIDGPREGEEVLCHAGVALQRVEPASFLYPFLGGEERDVDSVLAEVRRSTAQKAEDVISLRAALELDSIATAAEGVGRRLRGGGRLFAFGNGGSATDAEDLAADCLARGWPAVALTDDAATVTAVANDVGFEAAFARQLIALAGAGDVAVAISTSGSSANVVAGLEEARRRGMLTCAIVGYDGGRLAELGWIDHLLIVRSDYIPRIQEAQATAYHLLVEAVGTKQ